MTTTQKSLLVILVFAAFALLAFIKISLSQFSEYGGFKQLAIDTGRDVKEIIAEIKKD